VRGNTEKATVKKSDYITHVISKLATANAKLTVLAEGPVKDKQTGEIKTLKPACTNSICQPSRPNQMKWLTMNWMPGAESAHRLFTGFSCPGSDKKSRN